MKLLLDPKIVESWNHEIVVSCQRPDTRVDTQIVF